MLGLLSGPPGFTCWVSFTSVFSFMYYWVLVFALSPFLYLDLYDLGDDAWISCHAFVSVQCCLVVT